MYGGVYSNYPLLYKSSILLIYAQKVPILQNQIYENRTKYTKKGLPYFKFYARIIHWFFRNTFMANRIK